MNFRKIQNNTNWNNLNIIVEHNVNNLHNLKIPYFLKNSFSKFLAFYPLPDNKEKTFFKLPKYKKIPFLFNYLIKKLKENNINKSEIQHLIKLKEDYNSLKSKKISEIEKMDRIKMYLISKNHELILNLYLDDKKIKNKFYELSKYIKLMTDVLIDKHIDNIKINHRKWMKDNNIQPNRTNKIGVHLSDTIYYDILKSSNDISEWDLFIEEEVQKRLLKILENNKSSGKSLNIKVKNKYPVFNP